MLEWLIWIGIVIVISYIIAAMRRGSSVIGSRPRRLQSFTATSGPQETLKAIIHFAQQAGYNISAIDESKGQLVLEESTSVMSWGFFFPVFVSQQSDNATLVEVGIMSKLPQVGPIVSSAHEKCVNGMKAALFAQDRI